MPSRHAKVFPTELNSKVFKVRGRREVGRGPGRSGGGGAAPGKFLAGSAHKYGVESSRGGGGALGEAGRVLSWRGRRSATPKPPCVV